MTAAFAEYEQQLQDLRQSKDVNRRLVAPRPSTYINKEEILERFLLIQDGVKSIFSDVPGDISFSQGFQLPSDTSRLLISILLLPLDRHFSLEHQVQEVSAIAGLNNLFRALLSKTACQWVFETDFPNFDDQNSALLDLYRRNLVLQKGM